MILREGGRRLGALDTGGSGGSKPDASEEGSGAATLRAGDEVDDLGLSIQGFSLGTMGVVYCDKTAVENSHRLGAHTPTSTRQAAITRLALQIDESEIFQRWKIIPYFS